MTPLTADTIALILEYIHPPSQLDIIPPHLLSSSLLQRHHYLQLSPHHPASYLAWPSDHNDLVIRLLQLFQRPTDDRLYSSFSVRYTSDPESAFAHVSILPEYPPGLRLIFQWNSPDGWKYHNIALMPFPPNSSESLQDPHVHPMIDDQLDPDSSYWDAYAYSDDSQVQPPTKVDPQQDAEDSYWSQYAAIHGSGDSTLPTPPSLAQKQQDSKRIFVSYPIPPHTTVSNPLDPPSPTDLARRLADLATRLQTPPLAHDSNSESRPYSPPYSPSSYPLPPPSTALSSADRETTSSKISLASASCGDQQNAGVYIIPHHESHEALKDAIRGVYRLWKSSRELYSTATGEREEFFGIVQQVVAEFSPY